MIISKIFNFIWAPHSRGLHNVYQAFFSKEKEGFCRRISLIGLGALECVIPIFNQLLLLIDNKFFFKDKKVQNITSEVSNKTTKNKSTQSSKGKATLITAKKTVKVVPKPALAATPPVQQVATPKKPEKKPTLPKDQLRSIATPNSTLRSNKPSTPNHKHHLTPKIPGRALLSPCKTHAPAPAEIHKQALKNLKNNPEKAFPQLKTLGEANYLPAQKTLYNFYSELKNRELNLNHNGSEEEFLKYGFYWCKKAFDNVCELSSLSTELVTEMETVKADLLNFQERILELNNPYSSEEKKSNNQQPSPEKTEEKGMANHPLSFDNLDPEQASSYLPSNEKEAIKRLTILANNENAETSLKAQQFLCEHYANPINLANNFENSLEQFEFWLNEVLKTADRLPEARKNKVLPYFNQLKTELGKTCYEKGLSSSMNDLKHLAPDLFRKADRLGHLEATLKLASMYIEGFNEMIQDKISEVLQDLDQANEYAAKVYNATQTLSQNDPAAKKQYGEALSLLGEIRYEKDQEDTAFEFFNDSAQALCINGMINLAMMYSKRMTTEMQLLSPAEATQKALEIAKTAHEHLLQDPSEEAKSKLEEVATMIENFTASLNKKN